MRTVDPLGRHEECERIVEAARRGHVVVVGHAALGAEATRRRVRRALAEEVAPIDLDEPSRGDIAIASMADLSTHDSTLHALVTEHGVRVVLHVDDAIDPDVPVDVPDALAGDEVTIVRLGRLGRRRIDRLIDDRLARRGMEPTWLGRTDRALVHAQSAGYPLLAAALVDDRIAPERAARAPGAVATILRALSPRERHMAAVLASLGGIDRARAERHLDPTAIGTLVRLGLASDTSDGLHLGAAFRDRLATTGAASREAAPAIDEIVHAWSSPRATSPSELVLAARALAAGTVRSTPQTHAMIAAIAAASSVARSPGDAAALAATVQRLDPDIVPSLMRVLVAGEGSPVDALLHDVAERGLDPFASRLGDELLRAMVLVPDDAAMTSEGVRALPEGSPLRRLAQELVELDRARVALDAGRHDEVVAACETVLASGEDPLVTVRAHGMRAVSAGALGRTSMLLECTSALRSHVAQTTHWTSVAIAITTRTIAQVRATAASIGLPRLTVLDEALDRLVARAAATEDHASIAYACIAELASKPSPEQAQATMRTLGRLPSLPARTTTHTIASMYDQEPPPPEAARLALREHPWTVALGASVSVLTRLEDASPASLLERCESHVSAGVHPTATLRLAREHLRLVVGEDATDDLDDLAPGDLTPVLRALLWHVQGVRSGDARMVADAAALVVAARYRRLAQLLIDDAERLGADPDAITRLRNRLAASVAASSKRLRANRQWIDRDAAGLAAAGLTDLQISDLVGVPLGTVRTRSRAIMADLGLPSRELLRESAPDPVAG